MVDPRSPAHPEKLSGYPHTPVADPGPHTPALGERISWYRRRRGMTQKVLAGLAGGRTEDWMGKVETGKIPLDRLSVITLIADALGVPLARLLADAPGESARPTRAATDIEPLRAVLSDYTHLAQEPEHTQPDLDLLRAEIGESWSAYQDSRYTRAVRLLPGSIVTARSATRTHNRQGAAAQAQLAMAYQGAAMVLTKIGDLDLAWLAADRGLSAAFAAHDALVLGSLYRSVAHCLLANRRLDAATDTIDTAVRLLAPRTGDGPDHLSIYGTLFLVGAMAAAREGARTEANHYLAHAQRTAEQLGHDGNHMWTAFGPTTVRMHQVSAALELGDIETALARGERIDTSALPVERRVRHKLDLARAHHARNHREQAEGLLLDADELAPEQIATHYITRLLLTAWVPRPTGNRRIHALTEQLGIV